MSYEIFLDVLFLTNTVMDYFLLRLTTRLSGGKATPLQSLGGALTGAFGYCILILYPFGTVITVLLEYVIVTTIMVRFGCGLRTWKSIGKGLFLLYIAGFLMGGLMEVISRWTKIQGIWQLLFWGTCSYGGYAVSMPRYLRWKKRQQMRYQIILFMNGEQREVTAFLDTGNCLYDPVGKKPVSIIQREVLEKLCDEATKKSLYAFANGSWDEEKCQVLAGRTPHFLTFTGVGKQQGLLAAFTLDQMIIKQQDQSKIIKFPIVAFSTEDSTAFAGCEMILHSDLLDS